MGFWRRRSTPPGAGTATVTAVARVEPLGVAPSAEAGGTATVTAVARVEPAGAIPPVPATAPTNVVEVEHEMDGAFIVGVDDQFAQFVTSTDPANTDLIREQEAEDPGFSQNVVSSEGQGSDDVKVWLNQFDGVTRFYRARAENGSGNGPWSSTVSAKHIEAAPGAVQNLDAIALSDEQIRVTWDAPATGGAVERYFIESLEGHAASTTGLQSTFGALDPATAYGFRVRAAGPDNQVGPWTNYIFRATRHPTPGLLGCVHTPDPAKPNITEDRLLITDNATENTNIRVERNGAFYALLGDGNREYTPSSQSGTWRVFATGGTTTHPTGGNVSIPNSGASGPVSMPFSEPCTPL